MLVREDRCRHTHLHDVRGGKSGGGQGPQESQQLIGVYGLAGDTQVFIRRELFDGARGVAGHENRLESRVENIPQAGYQLCAGPLIAQVIVRDQQADVAVCPRLLLGLRERGCSRDAIAVDLEQHACGGEHSRVILDE